MRNGKKHFDRRVKEKIREPKATDSVQEVVASDEPICPETSGHLLPVGDYAAEAWTVDA